MSHSVNLVTPLHDQEGIIKGLCRMGFSRDMIEVSDTPMILERYTGDKVERRAHIRVKREVLQRVLGGNVYNDLGFVRNDDGTYSAIIEKQYGFQDCHLKKLVMFHNVEVAKASLDAQGHTYVERIDARGRPQLEATFKQKKRVKVAI